MSLKGSRTEKALKKAFDGEAQAFTKYTLYAEKAEEEGYTQIAKLFRDIANDERGHAEIWRYYLNNGKTPDTLANLKDCFAGEDYENMSMYPQMAELAEHEGFDELAAKFLGVSKIEGHHREMFRKYIENMEAGTLYERNEVVCWMCLNCGHLHFSKKTPKRCEVCDHPQGYFVEYIDRY